MAAPIQKLAHLSAKLFGTLSLDKITKDHMAPLIQHMNNITKEDLCFDVKEVEEMDTVFFRTGDAAPVSYMPLVHHKAFTMAVFVVRPGGALPLHDHPEMHGLLKVIHGSVKISSYSETDKKSLPDDITQTEPKKFLERVKTVVKNDGIILNEEDDCCVLTPVTSNIHEIIPVSKTSAFLDILSPPYDDNERNCHYYKELITRQTDTIWLIEIPQPSSYWCNTIKYTGPPLSSFLEYSGEDLSD